MCDGIEKGAKYTHVFLSNLRETPIFAAQYLRGAFRLHRA